MPLVFSTKNPEKSFGNLLIQEQCQASLITSQVFVSSVEVQRYPARRVFILLSVIRALVNGGKEELEHVVSVQQGEEQFVRSA